MELLILALLVPPALWLGHAICETGRKLMGDRPRVIKQRRRTV